jgi:hypothetical protein
MSKGAKVAETLFVPGKGGSFDLANPRAVNWFLDKGGSVDYIKGINRTTGDQMKTLIGKAIDNGQSYTQTAKQISQKFDGFSRSRAQMIATHESAQAYEAGNRMIIDTVADTGIQMQKKWMTSGDDLVTPECTANGAEGWIPLKQSHKSGHQEPPRFPRCRCYEIYQEVPRSAVKQPAHEPARNPLLTKTNLKPTPKSPKEITPDKFDIITDSTNKDEFYRVHGTNNLHWAGYNKTGNRVSQGVGSFVVPTDSELLLWDTKAKLIVENTNKFESKWGIDPTK